MDGKQAALEERLLQHAISVYGYAKRTAAVHCAQRRKPIVSHAEALQQLVRRVEAIHDPLTWDLEVRKRIAEIERGEW
jgi:hypothetical protein